MTRQTLYRRLEQGRNAPDEATLRVLAATLGFPAAFLGGEGIDELPKDAASFRSMSGMTARERDAALAAGCLAYLFADWVESRFNSPTPDPPDLSHERTPSAAARELPQHWGLGEKPTGNLLRLLKSKGVRVQPKRQWGVSVAALAYRLHKIEIFSDRHLRAWS